MAYELDEIIILFDELETKNNKTIASFDGELHNIRAGRANAGILDKILVDYYGAPTPIKQMANITVAENRILVISVWDVSQIKNVEKAILAANIGITPNCDGKVIRIIFPELTQDRRVEIVKQIKKMAEDMKVTIRNHRREAIDEIRKMKKDNLITEDDLATYEKDVDTEQSKAIEKIDTLTRNKEQEVMQV